jgi:hypothetical protein
MTRIDLLTPSNLAEQIKCSLATLKRWRRRGEGPPWFRLGVGIRYAAADVEAWVLASRSQLSVVSGREPRGLRCLRRRQGIIRKRGQQDPIPK